MDFLFGRRRQNQRTLQRAISALDRERQRMEAQDKKIIADKKAKMNQMDSVKVVAKDLVKKFIVMKANIQAVSLRVQTLKSQDATKAISKAIQFADRQLNFLQIQKIMEFEKQSEIMDMEKVMGDAIDDALGDVDDKEEIDRT